MASTIATRAPLLGEPLPVELMNTVWADRGGVHDALATDEELAAWVEAIRDRLAGSADLAEPAAGWAALAQASGLQGLRDLRDAMRRLTACRTADPRPAAASAMAEPERALDVVNRVAAASPSWVSLAWEVGEGAGGQPRQVRHVGEPAARGLASLIATQYIEMLAAGDGPELRACLAPGCVLYFAKDHTRREWCSTACGNRARAARHYRRHKGAGD